MWERLWESTWLRWLLSPLGWGYGSAMALRRRLFAGGYLRSHRFSQPVLSVGNLTVGGSGKTPIVSAILSRLPDDFCPALVLSRGYGGRFELEGAELNDEGHLLRTRHPDHLHAQGVDRVAAANAVLRDAGAGPARSEDAVKLILLDDGAQHLKIQRDVEILLFDARQLTRPQNVLPAGPWRESLEAARGADAVILTRCDRVAENELDAARALIKKHAAGSTLFSCRHRPSHLAALRDFSERRPPRSLQGMRVGLVSGIADPGSFRSSVQSLGGRVVWEEAFSDHCQYSESDLEDIRLRAAADPVDAIVITEKDRPKIAALEAFDAKEEWLVLCIEIEFDDDEEAFRSWLARRLNEVSLELE